MKKPSALRTILLILVAIAVCCAVFFSGRKSANGKQQKIAREAVAVMYADNAQRSLQTGIEGTLQAERTADLSFSVSGKLEAGEIALKTGSRFKKGQLLAQINNREAFDAFSRRKIALATVVVQAMPEIRSRFPQEESKWSRFIVGFKPENLVPEMPAFGSSEERAFIAEKNIPEKLNALQQEQDAMTGYFYLAPFDGYVLDVKKSPGSTLQKGTVVAQLAQNGPLQLHVEIPAKVYTGSNEALVSTTEYPVKLSDGTVIGTRGPLLNAPQLWNKDRSAIRQVYAVNFTSRQPLKHGTRVTMSTSFRTDFSCIAVPAAAIDGNLVQVVRNGKLETRQVTIVGKEGDSVFVTGLKDGDAVAVAYRHRIDPKLCYFPE